MTGKPQTTSPAQQPTQVPPAHTNRRRGLGHHVQALYRVSWTGERTATSTGHRRVVRSVDPSPRDVHGVEPLKVAGYADGVQTRFLLRHHDHRPISLLWAAAGAVTSDATLIEFGQRLELVGSAADEALLTRLSEVGNGLPFHLLQELTPWGVAASTDGLLNHWREELERQVVATAEIPTGRHLVVDGSIRQHTGDQLVGAVKSVDTQYLADESALPYKAGWRSPVFSLPATTTAEQDVVSCYLRLHDAPGSTSWSHSLIRLEARDPETLDAACALALRQRQFASSGDGRWAVHLAGIHVAEQVLRAFRHPCLEL
jgi:hypothetical protein